MPKGSSKTTRWDTFKSPDGRVLGQVRRWTSFTWEAAREVKGVPQVYLTTSRHDAEEWLKRSAS
jgi:hypothetical protein